MKFIANSANDQYLDDFLSKKYLENCSEIKAAIAYVNYKEFFDLAINNNIRLTFYGRLDYQLPVSLIILKKFIVPNNPNFVCRLVSDIFHAKVIWFVGVGIYIGSANLTYKSWEKNIEAGVVFDQNDIDQKLKVDIENFFKFLDDNSSLLTSEMYKKLEDYENYKKDIQSDKKIKEYFKLNILPSKGIIHKKAS